MVMNVHPVLKKIAFVLGILVFVLVIGVSGVPSPAAGQFPTLSVATVTGTPRGLWVRAIGEPHIPLNVRSGPSPTSSQVGVFLVGQEAPAFGYYGSYVQIEYAGAPGDRGWVVLDRVEVFGGTLPMMQAPPTETPSITKTIDPTLAAQFIITAQPSRLPTFTEPPALLIPTFQAETGATATGGIPIGYVIITLAGLGLFLSLIAILRRG
ncbi:MAG: SH3 domain-containing protein [Chloroflexi bacterium]|nr:SH3 domain-containing protein [Chloroflexota bacterium]